MAPGACVHDSSSARADGREPSVAEPLAFPSVPEFAGTGKSISTSPGGMTSRLYNGRTVLLPLSKGGRDASRAICETSISCSRATALNSQWSKAHQPQGFADWPRSPVFGDSARRPWCKAARPGRTQGRSSEPPADSLPLVMLGAMWASEVVAQLVWALDRVPITGAKLPLPKARTSLELQMTKACARSSSRCARLDSGNHSALFRAGTQMQQSAWFDAESALLTPVRHR